ncbi:MAG: cupin domain-containing protein [Candidatus Omnitrophica bacterium]|nr:cupin domain-containing protein [Candidatus Omnitrophota bacterium]
MLSACAASSNHRSAWVGQIISPGNRIERVDWVEKEKTSDLSVRNLKKTDAASFQIVRLNKAERPHVHENHDLTVFVLSGEAIVHFGDEQVAAGAGDIVEIPRGVAHWAENRSKQGSEVYTLFTPAFDGKDTRYL